METSPCPSQSFLSQLEEESFAVLLQPWAGAHIFVLEGWSMGRLTDTGLETCPVFTSVSENNGSSFYLSLLHKWRLKFGQVGACSLPGWISVLSWCLCFRCMIANTHSSLTGGETCLDWGWQRIGTDCPGGLWSLQRGRHSKPSWMGSGWSCRGRGVELGGLQRSLPTQTLLGFSVLLYLG